MVTEQEIIEAFGFFVRVRLQNGPSPGEMGPTVGAWELVFDDVSGHEFHEAARKWAKTSKWWPAPSEVRSLIPRLAAGNLALEAADADRGRDRWPEIVRHAGSLGRSCPNWPEVLAARIGVKDSERLRRAIDDAGGWRNLCLAEHDATRAGMGRRFAASWDRQARAMTAGVLPGSQQGALASNDPKGGQVVDILAELERRKNLGAARG